MQLQPLASKETEAVMLRSQTGLEVVGKDSLSFIRFLSLGTVDILSWLFLYVESCPGILKQCIAATQSQVCQQQISPFSDVPTSNASRYYQLSSKEQNCCRQESWEFRCVSQSSWISHGLDHEVQPRVLDYFCRSYMTATLGPGPYSSLLFFPDLSWNPPLGVRRIREMNKDTKGTRINREASRYRYAKKVESGPGEKTRPPCSHRDMFSHASLPLNLVLICTPLSAVSIVSSHR